MYAPHNNPEMQERREDCGRGHQRRDRGQRRGFGEGRGFGGRPEGWPEGRPEGRRGGNPEGRRGRNPEGRRGRGGRPEFTEASAALRTETGLLRGAVVAVAAGGTPEQVAQAQAILAEARRALFELLAQKPAEAPAEESTGESAEESAETSAE
ncbi:MULTISPECIES: hypothetical protein [unclassified Rhodococcus (in: high G+C Gram-positive bacteria)]|uniref:hypothetical protein n=1 Tax=unclassified Rhodococcus (in: high G+C Gram-positive bacteria) TaxID=192944 RepID=UPI0005E0ACCA|nr:MULTISPECIES: hypothetical protein [unclassified Rhodococcus (in: high G+C Gram-positive bacteria)]KJF24992.1 hypothetical protein SZ00_01918 [Rhodococcus sp. AD45]